VLVVLLVHVLGKRVVLVEMVGDLILQVQTL
jgi:hypothetical protein